MAQNPKNTTKHNQTQPNTTKQATKTRNQTPNTKRNQNTKLFIQNSK